MEQTPIQAALFTLGSRTRALKSDDLAFVVVAGYVNFRLVKVDHAGPSKARVEPEEAQELVSRHVVPSPHAADLCSVILVAAAGQMPPSDSNK